MSFDQGGEIGWQSTNQYAITTNMKKGATCKELIKGQKNCNDSQTLVPHSACIIKF